jgi:hypothetical protein
MESAIRLIIDAAGTKNACSSTLRRYPCHSELMASHGGFDQKVFVAKLYLDTTTTAGGLLTGWRPTSPCCR